MTKTDIASGDETVYHWDFRNRLTEVDSVSGGVTTGLATYVYDALDRRIKVVEGGATALKRDMVWVGCKVQLTETCDADRPSSIVNVDTTPRS